MQLLFDVQMGVLVHSLSAAQQQAAAAGGSGGPTQASQFVVGFTFDDWELMKRVVPEQQCLMKHRDAHAQPSHPAAGQQQQPQHKQQQQVQGTGGKAAAQPKSSTHVSKRRRAS